MNDLRNVCNEKAESRLRMALYISIAILALEVVGGIASNSLALLSDADHVLGDVLAVSLSYLAVRISSRAATKGTSWGMHRAEVFAAVANAVSLIVIAMLIFVAAYSRIQAPLVVQSIEMLAIAVAGLIGNIYVVVGLRGHDDLNVRGAYLHVVGDTLSSAIVIAGGVWMSFGGSYVVDPILSIFVGGLIIFGSVRLLRDSLDILLEKTPKGLDPDDVRAKMSMVEGVRDVHDVHIWSICSNIRAISAHVEVGDCGPGGTDEILSRLNSILREGFGIEHVTLQIEKNCADRHVH
ncbi:MAG: cation diffusion facilitator family transporter [Candidatus Thermoplasmatota archaeon]